MTSILSGSRGVTKTLGINNVSDSNSISDKKKSPRSWNSLRRAHNKNSEQEKIADKGPAMSLSLQKLEKHTHNAATDDNDDRQHRQHQQRHNEAKKQHKLSPLKKEFSFDFHESTMPVHSNGTRMSKSHQASPRRAPHQTGASPRARSSSPVRSNGVTKRSSSTRHNQTPIRLTREALETLPATQDFPAEGIHRLVKNPPQSEKGHAQAHAEGTNSAAAEETRQTTPAKRSKAGDSQQMQMHTQHQHQEVIDEKKKASTPTHNNKKSNSNSNNNSNNTSLARMSAEIMETVEAIQDRYDLDIDAKYCLDGDANKPCTLKFVGPVKSICLQSKLLAGQVWAGIVYDTEMPNGRNGCINSVEYFTCKQGYGDFVHPCRLLPSKKKSKSAGKKSNWGPSRPRNEHAPAKDRTSSLVRKPSIVLTNDTGSMIVDFESVDGKMHRITSNELEQLSKRNAQESAVLTTEQTTETASASQDGRQQREAPLDRMKEMLRNDDDDMFFSQSETSSTRDAEDSLPTAPQNVSSASHEPAVEVGPLASTPSPNHAAPRTPKPISTILSESLPHGSHIAQFLNSPPGALASSPIADIDRLVRSTLERSLRVESTFKSSVLRHATHQAPMSVPPSFAPIAGISWQAHGGDDDSSSFSTALDGSFIMGTDTLNESAISAASIEMSQLQTTLSGLNAKNAELEAKNKKLETMLFAERTESDKLAQSIPWAYLDTDTGTESQRTPLPLRHQKPSQGTETNAESSNPNASPSSGQNKRRKRGQARTTKRESRFSGINVVVDEDEEDVLRNASGVEDGASRELGSISSPSASVNDHSSSKQQQPLSANQTSQLGSAVGNADIVTQPSSRRSSYASRSAKRSSLSRRDHRRSSAFSQQSRSSAFTADSADDSDSDSVSVSSFKEIDIDRSRDSLYDNNYFENEDEDEADTANTRQPSMQQFLMMRTLSQSFGPDAFGSQFMPQRTKTTSREFELETTNSIASSHLLQRHSVCSAHEDDEEEESHPQRRNRDSHLDENSDDDNTAANTAHLLGQAAKGGDSDRRYTSYAFAIADSDSSSEGALKHQAKSPEGCSAASPKSARNSDDSAASSLREQLQLEIEQESKKKSRRLSNLSQSSMLARSVQSIPNSNTMDMDAMDTMDTMNVEESQGVHPSKRLSTASLLEITDLSHLHSLVCHCSQALSECPKLQELQVNQSKLRQIHDQICECTEDVSHCLTFERLFRELEPEDTSNLDRTASGKRSIRSFRSKSKSPSPSATGTAALRAASKVNENDSEEFPAKPLRHSDFSDDSMSARSSASTSDSPLRDLGDHNGTDERSNESGSDSDSDSDQTSSPSSKASGWFGRRKQRMREQHKLSQIQELQEEDDGESVPAKTSGAKASPTPKALPKLLARTLSTSSSTGSKGKAPFGTAAKGATPTQGSSTSPAFSRTKSTSGSSRPASRNGALASFANTPKGRLLSRAGSRNNMGSLLRLNDFAGEDDKASRDGKSDHHFGVRKPATPGSEQSTEPQVHHPEDKLKELGDAVVEAPPAPWYMFWKRDIDFKAIGVYFTVLIIAVTLLIVTLKYWHDVESVSGVTWQYLVHSAKWLGANKPSVDKIPIFVPDLTMIV